MALFLHKPPLRPEWMELLVGLAAGALLLLFLARRDNPGRLLRRWARRRVLWIVVFAFLGPGIRLALLPWAPMPHPTVHDEFVHLLVADTLMHARLANPPHPFSGFFETIYVIQRPAYSGSYPPGVGAFLAAGWVLTGQPWLGVWMAMVLCCGAVAWMQYRWLPPLAAWIGGLLCSLSLGISSYWMNSYFGGAVAAAGGALALGALPALLSAAHLQYACILALGWSLVWFTRPYESIVLGLLIGAVILGSLWRLRGQARGRRLGAAAIVVAGFIALDVAGMSYFNWRVTGDPLLSPYRLTQREYGVPHAFIWQEEIPEPAGLTPQQHRVYLFQRDNFRSAHSLTACWPQMGRSLKAVWAFYVGYPLTIPLVIGLFARGRKMRTLRLFLGAGIGWSLLYPLIQTQYLAPLTCVFFALASYGLLRIGRRRAWGAALAAGLVIASASAGSRALYSDPPKPRAEVARGLDAASGLHLVFVRYGPMHNAHDEWVYNRADIDHAKVIWANDLGRERNRQLIRYLGGREVWLAEPDGAPLLQRYPDSGQ
jgi:hypothetical protein